jgi:hypothetical protein
MKGEVYGKRDLHLLEWTRNKLAEKVEILLVNFNKGGKPDARKRK